MKNSIPANTGAPGEIPVSRAKSKGNSQPTYSKEYINPIYVGVILMQPPYMACQPSVKSIISMDSLQVAPRLHLKSKEHKEGRATSYPVELKVKINQQIKSGGLNHE